MAKVNDEWKPEAVRLWSTGKYNDLQISEILGVAQSTANDYLRKYRSSLTPREKKILIFDIETTPLIVYSWSLWPKFISHDFIIEDWSVLTWSAKWLGSTEVMNAAVSPDSPKDDFDVCEALWQLLDQADIVVAHNGDKFDIKKMNTRFEAHGLPEPNVYRSVDTLKVAKRKFSFTSNRLDHLGKVLVGDQKIKHEGFDMWRKCLAGDAEALKDMVKYNDQDVILLEKVYLKLRGWDHLHPNVAVLTENEEMACPVCGSNEMEPTGRSAQTQVGLFPTYRCKGCGKISKSRVSTKTAKQKAQIIVPAK